MSSPSALSSTHFPFHHLCFSHLLANNLGKVKSMIVMDFSGVMLFFAVVYVYDNWFENMLLWQGQILICTIWMLRTSFMNSTYAIDRALTMDHCPKEHRGKMASIETFFSATWCGSAMFGGYLIETMSLLNSFICTANIQLFAVTFNLFLFKYAYKGKFGKELNKLGGGTGVKGTEDNLIDESQNDKKQLLDISAEHCRKSNASKNMSVNMCLDDNENSMLNVKSGINDSAPENLYKRNDKDNSFV